MYDPLKMYTYSEAVALLDTVPLHPCGARAKYWGLRNGHIPVRAAMLAASPSVQGWDCWANGGSEIKVEDLAAELFLYIGQVRGEGIVSGRMEREIHKAIELEFRLRQFVEDSIHEAGTRSVYVDGRSTSARLLSSPAWIGKMVAIQTSNICFVMMGDVTSLEIYQPGEQDEYF